MPITKEQAELILNAKGTEFRQLTFTAVAPYHLVTLTEIRSSEGRAIYSVEVDRQTNEDFPIEDLSSFHPDMDHSWAIDSVNYYDDKAVAYTVFIATTSKLFWSK
jgi:hypothetical protein